MDTNSNKSLINVSIKAKAITKVILPLSSQEDQTKTDSMVRVLAAQLSLRP